MVDSLGAFLPLLDLIHIEVTKTAIHFQPHNLEAPANEVTSKKRAVFHMGDHRNFHGRVLLVHGSPGEGGEQAIVRCWLLPFDFDRFPARVADGQAPLTNLPPAALLEQLAIEYVHADLCEALMLSYAAENQARMQAMIAAHGNLERTQGRLMLEFQRVRQEDITDEILELSAART